MEKSRKEDMKRSRVEIFIQTILSEENVRALIFNKITNTLILNDYVKATGYALLLGAFHRASQDHFLYQAKNISMTEHHSKTIKRFFNDMLDLGFMLGYGVSG